MRKLTKFEYWNYYENWKEFFLNFNFKECGSEISLNDMYACFISWHKNPLKVDLYCGYYREDTKTGGCIAIDFKECFNKVSQCPIYVDLTEKPSSLWEAMILLENQPIEFSENGGRIEKDNNGNWIAISGDNL